MVIKYKNVIELLIELHDLINEGKCNSEQADIIRDEFDEFYRVIPVEDWEVIESISVLLDKDKKEGTS